MKLPGNSARLNFQDFRTIKNLKKTIFYIALFQLIFNLPVTGQVRDDKAHLVYERAFSKLDSMLRGFRPYSFKHAVFITENAYLEDTLSYKWFDDQVDQLAALSRSIMFSLRAKDHPDKERMEMSGKIFFAMTKPSNLKVNEQQSYLFAPYRYDFEDIWGEDDWRQMFVSKLLATHKGNCHSLPYLYKIVAEELKVPAYLAFAPNHIYIKQYFRQEGWYNTELTSGTFPSDAWLTVSGYTHLDAVRNAVYLDSLGWQETLAQCLVDLAKGHERKFPAGLTFREKCIARALEVHPKNVNALLMQAELYNQRWQMEMKKRGLSPDQWSRDPEMSAMYAKLNEHYAYLHHLGYRQMPRKMYVDWLKTLETEKEKYTDQKLLNEFKNLQTPSE